MISKSQISILLVVPLLFLLVFCSEKESIRVQEPSKSDSLFYLNHADSATYVGMNTCRQCHPGIYETFIKTGMGRGFGIADTARSSADFSKGFVKDAHSDFNYHAYTNGESIYMEEFVLEGSDTLHKRTEKVDYIIGSGQHTNSHLQNVNGYVRQMPMTYYTQKKKWDLPPGFENGFNTRFSRKIGLECMSCHNGYPEMLLGSENKYSHIPNGIDCERCHGPGSIHVQLRKTQSPVDTSLYIDRSIVNPAKLPVDLQFDICQRCHLQGNAVVKPGKSFYSYKPGMKLSEHIAIFLPKYSTSREEFIMASHADRLKQSACFIKSLPKEQDKSLKPYMNSLTCVTCHNPHVSVKETNSNVFNEACVNCHHAGGKSNLNCSDKNVKAKISKKAKDINCVNCHMPLSGSTDIPHVTIHDHFIRKPISQSDKQKIRSFLGLFAINEPRPDPFTRAKAYINQYSKFEQNKFFLDSAETILKSCAEDQAHYRSRLLIELYFTRSEYGKIIAVAEQLGEKNCLTKFFIQKSYSNEDAWLAYHVGEAYIQTSQPQKAVAWLEHAVKLASYHMDFRNKLAGAYATIGKTESAVEQYKTILKEDPDYVAAYTNLGYLLLVNGKTDEAFALYTKGYHCDPNNEALLLNLAGYYLFKGDKKSAQGYLIQLLKKNPGNRKATEALKQLKATA